MKNSIVLLALTVAMMSSCATPVRFSEIRRDSVAIRNDARAMRFDSVYVYRFDSVLVRERPDTVWIERHRTDVVNRTVRDTVLVKDVETEYRVETVVKEVETNKLTWLQKTQIYALWAIVAVGAVAIIFCWIKKRLL